MDTLKDRFRDGEDRILDRVEQSITITLLLTSKLCGRKNNWKDDGSRDYQNG